MQIRAIQLNKYIKEYKVDNDYENAMQCDIKYRLVKNDNTRIKQVS